MKYKNTYLLMLVMLGIPFFMVGQEDSTKPKSLREIEQERAIQHLEQLKEGVLVVRLQTNNRKIQTLQSMVRNNPKDKRNKKLLEKTIQEKEDLQKATVEAYQTNYNFSKVLFMPDTCAAKLLEGETKGIFLNENLEIDAAIELDAQHFYISYIGTPPVSTSSGQKSLLIADRYNQLVSPPFPRVVKLYRFIALILPSADEASEIPRAVERQQRTLEKYAERWLD